MSSIRLASVPITFEAMSSMVETTARARFGWTDAYLQGEAFARFVADESARVAGVLRRLGL